MITQPKKEAGLHGRMVYTSRWSLILRAYNQVRARLLNSEALLEGTNLQLFTINEATLTRWYKDTMRRDEIKILLQGLSLRQEPPCTSDSLPPPAELPSTPSPPPSQPFIFAEPEDTVGQARLGRKSITPTLTTLASLASTSASPPSLTTPPVPTVSTPVSRTTEWRRRTKGERTFKARKEYTCRQCNQAMIGTRHTQFRGQRYAPTPRV